LWVCLKKLELNDNEYAVGSLLKSLTIFSDVVYMLKKGCNLSVDLIKEQKKMKRFDLAGKKKIILN
jgi:hypothetical protein